MDKPRPNKRCLDCGARILGRKFWCGRMEYGKDPKDCKRYRKADAYDRREIKREIDKTYKSEPITKLSDVGLSTRDFVR